MKMLGRCACLVLSFSGTTFAGLSTIHIQGESVPTGRIAQFSPFYGAIEEDGDIYIHCIWRFWAWIVA